jgi:hypothetical protein
MLLLIFLQALSRFIFDTHGRNLPNSGWRFNLHFSEMGLYSKGSILHSKLFILDIYGNETSQNVSMMLFTNECWKLLTLAEPKGRRMTFFFYNLLLLHILSSCFVTNLCEPFGFIGLKHYGLH